MSQQQPQRPQATEEPIKYGTYPQFPGNLQPNPSHLKMQSAENRVLGQTQKGSPASVMQSAAARNERAGHGDDTDITTNEGLTVAENDGAGNRIVNESIADQVVGQFKRDPITIGEALEATAVTVGDISVDKSDAAAIRAAELRATGGDTISQGGVAAAAQSAATVNAQTMRHEEKIKIGDVLMDAAIKLPGDRPATREDAEEVAGAEMRENPKSATHPSGVAASVAAAARLNKDKWME
ncbi:PREDICTED: late embryogenesis abundant protein D-34-like [Nelumbo nucifera]|uniref:Late embryogenesis abundant protein D-34-like n=1 Tax=Nelumbo nucifera TaxID=4432 RepID=A0A1U8BJB0_NELNU|nr:PREDICTED: late embryogenesis abundant protein D-34-like [Nelumbo nucifera]